MPYCEVAEEPYDPEGKEYHNIARVYQFVKDECGNAND